MLSCLGGVMVNVLAIGPKFHGFKPRRGDGFLMVIRIGSTSPFGGEVNPLAPCHNILQHAKELYKVWKRDFTY
jgi:hypothetical protein